MVSMVGPCFSKQKLIFSHLKKMFRLLSVVILTLYLFMCFCSILFVFSYELNFMTSKPGPGVYTINVRSDHILFLGDLI